MTVSDPAAVAPGIASCPSEDTTTAVVDKGSRYPRQNRESTEGFRRALVVRKNNDKLGKRIVFTK